MERRKEAKEETNAFLLDFVEYGASIKRKAKEETGDSLYWTVVLEVFFAWETIGMQFIFM